MRHLKRECIKVPITNASWEYYSSGIIFTALKQVVQTVTVQELPVTFIRVEGLVTGLIAVNSLHEVVHSFCGVAIFVIRARDFHFL